MKDLKDKVVLVTGAARGMGRCHGLTFARQGARVAIVDVDENAIMATAQEMRDQGLDVTAYTADISDRSACFALADKVKSDMGFVDVLINNAGIQKSEEVLRMSEDSLRRITEVNYFGQVWMMQAFVPDMVERKSGHVVNICSGAGKNGFPLLGAYCATKHAMVGITDSLRHELRRRKVKFTIVNPGFIATGMFEGAKPPFITRWHEPQEVADAVLEAVQKNKAEIYTPRFVPWLTGFIRGLSMPRLSDPMLTLLQANKWFTSSGDSSRPF